MNMLFLSNLWKEEEIQVFPADTAVDGYCNPHNTDLLCDMSAHVSGLPPQEVDFISTPAAIRLSFPADRVQWRTCSSCCHSRSCCSARTVKLTSDLRLAFLQIQRSACQDSRFYLPRRNRGTLRLHNRTCPVDISNKSPGNRVRACVRAYVCARDGEREKNLVCSHKVPGDPKRPFSVYKREIEEDISTRGKIRDEFPVESTKRASWRTDSWNNTHHGPDSNWWSNRLYQHGVWSTSHMGFFLDILINLNFS